MATLNSREARRKRILERGSDRFALITGQIDSIPSSSPAPHQLHSVSLPASVYHPSNVGSQDEDIARTELPKDETSDGSNRSASMDITGRLDPQLHKCETRVDATRPPSLDLSRLPPLVPSTAGGSSKSAVDDPGPHRETRPCYTKLFTAKKISSSISASENIRILSAVTIALLVVLSHLGVPFLRGNIVSTIIATRPIYLVLLTDATILLAPLLLGKQALSEKTHEEVKTAQSEDAYSITQYLEMGLVMYKAFTAVFMDCSVYIVVVVCGISLLRGLF